MLMSDVKPKVVGGFPGFKMLNAWAQLWTERVGGQGEALNELWDHLRNKDDYSVGAWFKDVARFWDRTYGMMEDLWFFPVREGQEDRPTWVSLVWDGKGDTVTVANVRLTGGRVDEDRDPEPTDLEMLGADAAPVVGSGPPLVKGINKKQIRATLDNNRSHLSVTISIDSSPPPSSGHYVGFVIVPGQARPIAIIFLTVS
jgi:hypothetical protein